MRGVCDRAIIQFVLQNYGSERTKVVGRGDDEPVR
jgi:hypothetical protein